MPLFAPRMCAGLTRAMWAPRSSGVWLFGGCLFWLCVIYIWAAWIACKAAIWLAIIVCIWVAQSVVAIAYVPKLVTRKSGGQA